MDLSTLQAIVDTGGTAILTVMLWLVWKRLNDVTDRIIDTMALLADIEHKGQLASTDEPQAKRNPSSSP